MAKTLEESLKEQLGHLVFTVAAQRTTIEQLQEELTKLKEKKEE